MSEAICPVCSKFHATERSDGGMGRAVKHAQRAPCLLCRDTRRVPPWVAQRYLDALRGVAPGSQTVAFRRVGVKAE